MQKYPAISFKDPEFKSKLITNFMENGVTVITDVLDDNYCDNSVTQIFQYFEKLDTGIDSKDLINTWKHELLPPETRLGLFQALVSNIPIVWDIRSNSNIRTIFEIIYGAAYSKSVTDFIVSNDGISAYPNGIYSNTNIPDWAHVDQTASDWIYKCIQGQAVLTNTTAGFRASPKSFKIFSQLLDYYNSKGKLSNWLKIQDKDYNYFKNLVENIGGQWQIPILAPKGSFIIWSSATIHSNKLPDKTEIVTQDDPWKGSRCVVYVCYRPRFDFSDEEITTRASVVESDRVTNHWGTKIFPLRPDAYYYKSKKCTQMEKLMQDPKLVYDLTGLKPKLNSIQLSLIGHPMGVE